ncbi:hypothetical protein LCI18_013148 [Fusarium solani-melongenae]|uniref:Uncharacterized protein n=1 Tax=Fusarium solani subsp. cucurbitae TaxID=2747967 RepID=A0ACD3ZQ50_FUSSC|nr:hypothetical protein LCI18_013148 [Fusarium solani-melongenae]
MPGLLGSPTLTKMTVDAIGRLWRRLKKSKKQASEQGPEQDLEQDLHAFYSDSSESTEYLESYPDPLACFESVQGWVNGTSDTYNFPSAWRHPSVPSSIASFDGQANLFCGVSVRKYSVSPMLNGRHANS